MLSTWKFSLQMLGMELSGAFFSFLLVFSFKVVTTNSSELQAWGFVVCAVATAAYLSLLYGWMWMRGEKDAIRVRKGGEPYKKSRLPIVLLAMILPGLLIWVYYYSSVGTKTPAETVSNLIRVFWFAPYMDFMTALIKKEALTPLLVLFSLPGPAAAWAGYSLGFKGLSVWRNLIGKTSEEQFAREKVNASAIEILNDKNLKNLRRDASGKKRIKKKQKPE